ncbi:hypothetical protein EWM64_g8897, partial [Hericium alpestre]
MMFEEDFYTFLENTASITEDFGASAQCIDELPSENTDMASQ